MSEGHKSMYTGTVAIVGPFSFPDGGAAARRILGNARTLVDAGYDVIIGAGQMDSPEVPHQYEGIKIVSLSERTAEHLPTLIKHLRYVLMGKKTVEWLTNMHPKPSAVILYSGYAPYFIRLLSWCKKNNVPLIFDAVEWYGPHRISGGRFGLYRLSFILSMKYFAVNAKNIIAISRYLEAYYKNRGCSTIRIPPTLDTMKNTSQIEKKERRALRLGYTGNPTDNKDLLELMIEAVIQVNQGEMIVEFHIAGPTSLTLLAFNCLKNRGMTSLPNYIVAHGRVSHDESIEIIQNCDFSVLLRPLNTDSQAGFPTKVVESMSVGTPVICNITSDLSDHIIHRKTGMICEKPDSEILADTIREAASLNAEELAAMRDVTKNHAVKNFDFRNYCSSLPKFIQHAQAI